MTESPHLQDYLGSLDNLMQQIDEINNRVLADTDPFFTNNTNFYTKSYMVLMCTYLENYLKEMLMWVFDEMNRRLDSNKIPHNLVKWSLNPEQKWDREVSKYENFKLTIDKKGDKHKEKLGYLVSADTDRTIDIYKKFGIDLHANATFVSHIGIIQTIVEKRNDIVHHNDEASDISLPDVKEKANQMKEYIMNIDSIVVDFLN